jgi:FeS assembly SUF system protein
MDDPKSPLEVQPELESSPVARSEPGETGGASQASLPTQPFSSSIPPDVIEAGVVDVLKTIFDPEIPVNIYELGLIYDLDISPQGEVHIKMTLTSPACPVAGSLPPDVKAKVESVAGVTSAEVEVVWDPVWNPGMMSEAARLQLGFF